MIIQNKTELATSELRRAALEIIEAGIARVLPSVIMQSAIRFERGSKILSINGDVYHLSKGRVIVIGGGKASGRMSRSLEEILGPDNILDGIVTSKSAISGHGKIEIVPAGHPFPDERGVAGVNRMLALKERYAIGREDLVICLISGGGSALMPCPVDNISLQDKQTVTGLLLSCGAEINDINIVRKHLSCTKGGKLGEFFAPATVISLILSDVIGNDLSTIASGPTFPDSSTFAEAYQILEKYALINKVPQAVKDLLERGCRGLIAETPRILANCHNYIIGDITIALQAMERKAVEMGYHPRILSTAQKGDTAVTAARRANQVLNKESEEFDVFLLGGETTLKVPEPAGRGGRNQHYAAVSLMEMQGYAGEWVLASVGTDGTDFLPDTAGAIVDNQSARNLVSCQLDMQKHIACCDTNTLLGGIGNTLVVTGDTGTNVGDIMVYIRKKV